MTAKKPDSNLSLNVKMTAARTITDNRHITKNDSLWKGDTHLHSLTIHISLKMTAYRKVILTDSHL